jgi:hypothetical protein
VDILTQTLNQEVSTLNDNVRGMFNDRKMVVREEQNVVESAVSEVDEFLWWVIVDSDAGSTNQLQD